MSQYGEPWRYEDKGHFIEAGGVCILDGTRFRIDRKGERVAELSLPDELRRVVACVNACAGVPTEVLQRVREVFIGDVSYVVVGEVRKRLEMHLNPSAEHVAVMRELLAREGYTVTDNHDLNASP